MRTTARIGGVVGRKRRIQKTGPTIPNRIFQRVRTTTSRCEIERYSRHHWNCNKHPSQTQIQILNISMKHLIIYTVIQLGCMFIDLITLLLKSMVYLSFPLLVIGYLCGLSRVNER